MLYYLICEGSLMKKNIVLFFSVICISLLSAGMVSAADALKNFYAYEVKNVNIREFGETVRNAVESYNGADRGYAISGVNNAYIYTGKDSTYFVRLYPANKNTHIYIVANEKYDVKNNDITEYLNSLGYKYRKVSDDEALKEYQFDFYRLARQKQLGNFYISPDLVKPLKTGMSKLNDKLAKNSKKT